MEITPWRRAAVAKQRSRFKNKKLVKTSTNVHAHNFNDVCKRHRNQLRRFDVGVLIHRPEFECSIDCKYSWNWNCICWCFWCVAYGWDWHLPICENWVGSIRHSCALSAQSAKHRASNLRTGTAFAYGVRRFHGEEAYLPVSALGIQHRRPSPRRMPYKDDT